MLQGQAVRVTATRRVASPRGSTADEGLFAFARSSVQRLAGSIYRQSIAIPTALRRASSITEDSTKSEPSWLHRAFSSIVLHHHHSGESIHSAEDKDKEEAEEKEESAVRRREIAKDASEASAGNQDSVEAAAAGRDWASDPISCWLLLLSLCLLSGAAHACVRRTQAVPTLAVFGLLALILSMSHDRRAQVQGTLAFATWSVLSLLLSPQPKITGGGFIGHLAIVCGSSVSWILRETDQRGRGGLTGRLTFMTAALAAAATKLVMRSFSAADKMRAAAEVAAEKHGAGYYPLGNRASSTSLLYAALLTAGICGACYTWVHRESQQSIIDDGAAYPSPFHRRPSAKWARRQSVSPRLRRKHTAYPE